MSAPPDPFGASTAYDLQREMAAGALTALDLVRACLARIEALDRQGPALHAILAFSPEAEAEAAGLDNERRAGRVRGPLHGLPVLVKDNIESTGPMATTAGSLALAGRVAPRDAGAVARLRRGGAVILGKSNLSEWANFRSTRSTSGWSSLGGQTLNPYDPARSPGGSSSGSAVAVAAGLCWAALGTETDGSIAGPAALNSVVGVKPSVGLVGLSGVIPVAPSQDTVGPLARNVTDAALLLDALAGVDPGDPATGRWRREPPPVLAAGLDGARLDGLRLGVAREPFTGFHRDADALLERASACLRTLGADIVDPVPLIAPGELRGFEYEVLLHEFKAAIDAYLAGLGPEAPVHSLAELMVFNERHRDRVMPHFGQELFEMAQACGPLSEPRYVEALAACRRLGRERGIEAAIGGHDLAAVVSLTTSLPWLIDPLTGDHRLTSFAAPAAVAGLPHLSLPAGYVEGLPVGVSLSAGRFQEAVVFRIAAALERELGARRPPDLAAEAPHPLARSAAGG